MLYVARALRFNAPNSLPLDRFADAATVDFDSVASDPRAAASVAPTSRTDRSDVAGDDQGLQGVGAPLRQAEQPGGEGVIGGPIDGDRAGRNPWGRQWSLRLPGRARSPCA